MGPENDELTDLELNRLLREWSTPAAPPRLRSALFPRREPWWRVSVRIPVPALCVLVLLIGLVVWRRSVPPPSGLDFNEWRPVAELRPVVMRGNHVPN